MAERDAAAATQRLLEVMARLLGPEGCPWDRVQSHRSLVPYLLEEAYELADAIESTASPADAEAHPKAMLAVREELGDVLLQVVFHAQLGSQAGTFDFAAVADGLADKLIERHPHVFTRDRLETAAQVSEAWDRRKLAGRESRLDGIPPMLPALMLASKVSGRAARAGFEWGAIEDIYAKAHEEIEEFRVAKGHASASSAAAGEAPHCSATADHDAAELEFGDLLFSMVQLARWSKIDPERALRRSAAKFATRFRHMERELKSQGRDPADVAEAEWWTLWARAKHAENTP